MNFETVLEWGSIELEIRAHINCTPMRQQTATSPAEPEDFSIEDAVILKANGHTLTINESNFLFKISNNEIDELIMEAYQDEH